MNFQLVCAGLKHEKTVSRIFILLLQYEETLCRNLCYFFSLVWTNAKQENDLESNFSSSIYIYISSVNLDFLQIFLKTFLPTSSPLSLCLCFLLPYSFFCQNHAACLLMYLLCWRQKHLYYIFIYNCSIPVLHFFPFHQLNGTFSMLSSGQVFHAGQASLTYPK